MGSTVGWVVIGRHDWRWRRADEEGALEVAKRRGARSRRELRLRERMVLSVCLYLLSCFYQEL